MPFVIRTRPKMRKLRYNTDKAIWVYVMLKNGVSGEVVDHNGVYRKIYKYLVGWHVTVDERGNVLRGPDPEVVRLHEEGIL